MTTPNEAKVSALREQARYMMDELEALLAASARLPDGITEAVPPSGEPSVGDLLRGLAERDAARSEAVNGGPVDTAKMVGAVEAGPDAALDAVRQREAVDAPRDFGAVIAALVGSRQRLLDVTAAEGAGEAGRRALEEAVEDDRETLRAVAYRLHEAGVGR